MLPRSSGSIRPVIRMSSVRITTPIVMSAPSAARARATRNSMARLRRRRMVNPRRRGEDA
jgi:hypothetical protein